MDLTAAERMERALLRDHLAGELEEKLQLTDQVTPEEKMKVLVDLGAKIKFIDLVSIESEMPMLILTPAGLRQNVLLSGNMKGPRLEIEPLKFAIKNSLPVEDPINKGTETIFMIPYPHCEQGDTITGVSDRARQVGVRQIDFILISRKRMEALQKIMPKYVDSHAAPTPAAKSA